MEKNWERTLPFVDINSEIIKQLFEGILQESDIENIIPIEEGCRTTNYKVISKNSKYLLKIFFENDKEYEKEFSLLRKLSIKGVPVQKVYRICRSELIKNRVFGIYEYVEGISLAKSLEINKTPNSEIVKKAARILAQVHKHKFSKSGFFDADLNVIQYVPPLKEWYRLFINKKVEDRLGRDITNKIKIAVKKYEQELDSLDKDIRMVHGDFQGTNILVNNNNLICVLDWEFTMAGHPLADIGQFFRYDEYYNRGLVEEFEHEYRIYSDYVLNDNWYNISRLRDMINLIQLIGAEDDMPNKFNDIKSIIIRSLDILI